MTVKAFTNLRDAFREIKRDVSSRQRRLKTATRKAARQTRNLTARELVPRAFGELADSLHVEDTPGGADVIADAPHAAAVENGSRPHLVPLEALIAWVKLRGLQGLTAKGGLKRRRRQDVLAATPLNSETAARRVATELRARLGRKGAAKWYASANLGSLAERETGADAATVDIAKRIQAAILKRGTKPHRFMFAAVDPAMHFLEQFVAEALPDP